MTFAVTGATGFVGRHVVSEIERRGLSVTLVGRSLQSLSVWQGKHRLVGLDLHDAPDAAFDRLGRPDCLLHLAWDGLPNYKSAHHLDRELPAQFAFLNAAVAGGLKNLLVTGTCLEYGMQSGELAEVLPSEPTVAYAQAKNRLREQLQELGEANRLNLTWARLFYTFGEGQAATSLLPQLRAAVAKGDRVFNMSGGEQLRDYLPIERVATYLVDLAQLKRNVGVVNVCSGTPVSVRSLVDGWIRENGWSIRPSPGFYPYSDYEPMEFWGDRTKLDLILQS